MTSSETNLYTARRVASSNTSSYVFAWSASFRRRPRTCTRSSRSASFRSSMRMGAERYGGAPKRLRHRAPMTGSSRSRFRGFGSRTWTMGRSSLGLDVEDDALVEAAEGLRERVDPPRSGLRQRRRDHDESIPVGTGHRNVVRGVRAVLELEREAGVPPVEERAAAGSV